MTGHRDRWTAELKVQAIEKLQGAIDGLADRIERGIEEGADRQYLLEDTLWHLDQLTGRSFARGARMFDQPSPTGSRGSGVMTMAEDECRHEMPVSQCAWCGPKKADPTMERFLGTEEVEPSYETAQYQSRVAMYDGKCRRCGTAFEVGDTIGWSLATRITVGTCCWTPGEGGGLR
jgi:hypothetical protein